ncbi:hypothetical protein BBR47_49780 [Brevibacillus brevis NBRC 100599]|uniref:Uncharacterized protein n=1 Tax=Brevibacillus brevis (strain 47 / JCM 6285 / NBRC 100599) TaxID=358681 RepID=C0Z549_BREBN|nr:hypothetical protein BBR47_49780 [Brevibacillus brevis NBRC 100599]
MEDEQSGAKVTEKWSKFQPRTALSFVTMKSKHMIVESDSSYADITYSRLAFRAATGRAGSPH